MLLRTTKFSLPLAIIFFAIQYLITHLANLAKVDLGTGITHTQNDIFLTACLLAGFGIYHLRDWIWWTFQNLRGRFHDYFLYSAGVVIIGILLILYLALIGFSNVLLFFEMLVFYAIEYAFGFGAAVAREWARNNEGWWSVLFTD